MATIQTLDLRVSVEPTIPTPELDFGPSSRVTANAVLLTRESLRTVGAYPPRSGHDWDCILAVYTVIAGVETALDMSSFTVTATYWDDVTMVANDLTIVAGTDTNQLVVSFEAADLPTAGMYRFAVVGEQTETFDICSGWLEILPAIPS